MRRKILLGIDQDDLLRPVLVSSTGVVQTTSTFDVKNYGSSALKIANSRIGIGLIRPSLLPHSVLVDANGVVLNV